MYDSDKSSISSSDSSDSEDEHLSKQEKQSRKNDKRIKNAIAFKFYERKEQQKFRYLFQGWKDFCLMNYRSNLVMAIKHYENSLCLKGFDGIMEYAMNSTSFKQKIVMFYYHFYMNQFMRTLKNGYKAQPTLGPENQNHKTLQKVISETNKSLDSLFENNNQQKSKPTILQKNTEKLQQIKKTEQIKIQRSSNKINQSTFLQFADFFKQEKTRKLKLAFKSIQLYLPNLKQSSRSSPPKKEDTQYLQEEQQANRQDQFLNQSQSNQFRRNNQTNRIYDNSRQFNSMINSRRSAFSQSNGFSGLKQNKSRRKLAPIVQQVQLPAFVKKQVTQPRSKQKNPASKSPIKPIIENQSQKWQRKISSEKIIQPNQQSREVIPKMKIPNNQEQDRQKIQRETKQKTQQKKNRIAQTLAKGKLLELCLLNDLPPEEQNFFTSYRQLTIETLSRIKSR